MIIDHRLTAKITMPRAYVDDHYHDLELQAIEGLKAASSATGANVDGLLLVTYRVDAEDDQVTVAAAWTAEAARSTISSPSTTR